MSRDRKLTGTAPPRLSSDLVDLLQPPIHGLALQGEDAGHALVDASEGLALHESFEAFDPQRELAKGQRSLTREARTTRGGMLRRRGPNENSRV